MINIFSLLHLLFFKEINNKNLIIYSLKYKIFKIIKIYKIEACLFVY